MEKRRHLILFFKKREGICDLETIVSVLQFNFKSLSILVGHSTGEFSHVCGFLCLNSSKTTILEMKIRSLFSEYELKIQFFKGWGPICLFFSKQDFSAFGSFSREQIILIAEKSQNHTKFLNINEKGKSRSRASFFNRGPWSTWSIIKRGIILSICYKVLDYVFSILRPFYEEEFRPFVLPFIEDFWKWVKGESFPPEPPPSPNTRKEIAFFTLIFLGTILYSFWTS